MTALIGPSGCGKSTFLRILNRMHELIPSASMAGEVMLDGTDIYDPSRRLTDSRRQIGMVFQKPNPFPAMSIYDNVIAGLKLTGQRVTKEQTDDVRVPARSAYLGLRERPVRITGYARRTLADLGGASHRPGSARAAERRRGG